MDADNIILMEDVGEAFVGQEQDRIAVGEGDEETIDGEGSGVSGENIEESPEPEPVVVQPTRRSNRQPKKKKRNSSDSGGEEQDDSTLTHASHPLSNTANLIQIGPEHQAVIPPMKLEFDAKDFEEEKDECIWSIPADIDENDLSLFIGEAVGRFRMPVDRALYILMKNEYKFDIGIEQVGKRRQLVDNWTDEESKLFESAFMVHGKRFDRIRSAMPNRSMASVIQHYYNTKKVCNYVSSYEARFKENLTDDDSADSDSDDFLEGTCENCGEKTDRLKVNPAMNRSECPACITYLRLMRVPRPANLRYQADQLKRLNASCPQSMRKHVAKYDELTAPGTGDPVKRLRIGSDRRKEDEDDDCLILNECTLERASSPYDVKTTSEEDPVDPNTCRMTRDFDNDVARTLVKKMQKNTELAIPLIWRKKTTICMEDIGILNEEARKTVYEASIIFNRVKNVDLNNWKQEMSLVKSRMDRKTLDSDLAPSVSAQFSRSGRVRHDYSWSDEERSNALKCFHWYGDDFETVADVVGTKSMEQVKSFYSDLGQPLLDSIEKYRADMRQKLKEKNMADLKSAKEETNRFNVMDYISID